MIDNSGIVDLSSLPTEIATLIGDLTGEKGIGVIGVLADSWIQRGRVTRSISDGTMRGYRHHIANFVKFVGPDTKAKSIDEDMILAWMASMGHLRASSLNTAVAPVRSMFRWLTETGHIDQNPTLGIRRAKTPPTVPRDVTASDLARILQVSDFRERTIVLLMLHLGMRCCEVSRSRAGDWDRQDNLIVVHGKGAKDRILPMSAEIVWALDLWLDDRRRCPIFTSRGTDEPISAARVSSIITTVCKRARADASAHRLRHTTAHAMLKMGSPVTAVQRFLGHSSLATTSIYLAARDKDLVWPEEAHYAVPPELVAA